MPSVKPSNSLDRAALFRRAREHWKRFGLIQLDRTDYGEILDLHLARAEFIRALGRRTPAWVDLLANIRRFSFPNQPPDTYSGEQVGLTLRWVTTYRVDTPWMREWAVRAIVFVGDVLRSNPAAGIPIDRVVLDVVPEPDVLTMLAFRTVSDSLTVDGLLNKWLPDEPPPRVVSETREEFLQRMTTAWDRRCEAIGWSRPRTRRDLRQHAAWFVRHHVNGESIAEILADQANPPDTSTVSKALKSFPELIEL